MLHSLHISNYVLIDSLDVEFPEGLVVITGTTGAGKSILIGALSLLCGAKADAGVISPGAENCVVEAGFVFRDGAVEALCRENDLDYNGGNFLVRRVVSSSGRSRSFVNDEPVSVAVMEQLTGHLLDIHSQHDTMLLMDRKYQLSVLDAYAGNGALLEQAAEKWSALSALDVRIKETEEKLARARQENDYNAALYEQLEKARIQPGEIEQLEAEQYALSHSEQLKELLASTLFLFDSDSGQSPSVNPSLAAIGRNLEKLSGYLPAMKDVYGAFESARLEIKDASEQVQAADSSLSCDPERLQEVDARLSALYSLLKRHSCSTEEELAARRDALKEMVTGLDAMAESLEDMKKEREKQSADIGALFGELHRRREEACGGFAEGVMENLRFMELENARFSVEISQVPASSCGTDSVSFMFSATGAAPQPVAKCASGGELSRIMLSLKQFMSNFMNMPTIIFDEIDTGVSGSVADRMGRVICNMGSGAQVFAITHLPQVAAKGQAHYLVTKTVEGTRGTSSLSKLSGEGRVMEIARMLSGESTSPEAIANARCLLSDGN